jgi:hypothetical protein
MLQDFSDLRLTAQAGASEVQELDRHSMKPR